MQKTLFQRLFSLIFLLLASNHCVLAQSTSQAVILQYHHISSETPAVTSTSIESFEAHLLYLEEHQFTVLDLPDVINHLQENRPLPDKTAVITFDDSYLSIYTAAYPRLKALNWPFTIFVSSDLVGTNHSLYTTWEQLKEMSDSGATIANHTASHLHLIEQFESETPEQWLQRIQIDILRAEDAIEQNTGQSHKILAYPYGEYNPAIQTLIGDLDFIGVGQHSGPINANSDFTALPRFPFSGVYASMNSFPVKVQSLAFNLDLIKPLSPVTAENMPSAELKFHTNYRFSQLACYNNNQRIQVNPIEEAPRHFLIETHVNNQSRRFRYNCTAPGENGRYYWYSIHWVNPDIEE